MKLIIVDYQNDFISGTLAVPEAQDIHEYIKGLVDHIEWETIIATQDWHPVNHTSFAVNHDVEPYTMVDGEMKFPVHCIEHTEGAMIHQSVKNSLDKLDNVVYIKKGKDSELEEFSGATKEALTYLNKDDKVFIVGLATDYCVKATAIDVAKHVEQTIVLSGGIRGVDEDNSIEAINEMCKKGLLIL